MGEIEASKIQQSCGAVVRAKFLSIFPKQRNGLNRILDTEMHGRYPYGLALSLFFGCQHGRCSHLCCRHRYPVDGPRTTELRAILNAIFYLLRTGCQWRLLPREFPA